MKAKDVVRFACAASIAALCVLGLTACSGSGGLTGGVAATVNGTEIPEDKVTTYIEKFRESYGLTDKSDWKDWLESTGYTAETLREAVVNMYVEKEAVKLAAADQGIVISPEVIDGYVNNVKSNYSTDEAWQKALESVGMTEEEYRENIESSLLDEKLTEALAFESDPDDEQLLNYCTLYLSYFDGARRSSHILFSSTDTETAQSVLDQINAGSLDFETAAAQYSLDGSGANGGDVGWDKTSNFITEYTDALSELDEGEVSGLVSSTYGIHIIKCTEVFNAPDELTSVDQMPDELVDYVRNMLSSQNQSTAYSTFLQDYIDGLDVVINDIPRGVPYYVEVAKADTSSATNASASSSEASDSKEG